MESRSLTQLSEGASTDRKQRPFTALLPKIVKIIRIFVVIFYKANVAPGNRGKYRVFPLISDFYYFLSLICIMLFLGKTVKTLVEKHGHFIHSKLISTGSRLEWLVWLPSASGRQIIMSHRTW